MLLFRCSRFKYRFIKIDLVTVGKFCFSFSRVLGGVIDGVNVNSSARARLNHGLRDAQKVCSLTKVGTVFIKGVNKRTFVLVQSTRKCTQQLGQAEVAYYRSAIYGSCL